MFALPNIALFVFLPFVLVRSGLGAVELKSAPPVAEYSLEEGTAADEAVLFTPPDFIKVGAPKVAEGAATGMLHLRLLDAASGQPSFGRVNVVGPDGNYYEPAEGRLSLFSLSGEWPRWPQAWGNRPHKAPLLEMRAAHAAR